MSCCVIDMSLILLGRIAFLGVFVLTGRQNHVTYSCLFLNKHTNNLIWLICFMSLSNFPLIRSRTSLILFGDLSLNESHYWWLASQIFERCADPLYIRIYKRIRCAISVYLLKIYKICNVPENSSSQNTGLVWFNWSS